MTFPLLGPRVIPSLPCPVLRKMEMFREWSHCWCGGKRLANGALVIMGTACFNHGTETSTAIQNLKRLPQRNVQHLFAQLQHPLNDIWLWLDLSRQLRKRLCTTTEATNIERATKKAGNIETVTEDSLKVELAAPSVIVLRSPTWAFEA